MSTKDVVNRLCEMNKLLVGRLKEKEEDLKAVEELKSGRWFEKKEVDALVRDAIAATRESLEEEFGQERREWLKKVMVEKVLEVGRWKKKEAALEVSLEVEKGRVDELSKSISLHREKYHEEEVKGRANDKRSLEDMVAQVVGGKKRMVEEEVKVGRPLDPEKAQTFQVKVGVKVGGVLWEDGVEGVLVGLREMGFTICEGTRWLVGETERDKQRERGKNSSTVLAMIGGGMRAASELCQLGLWVGARWCSVKRFSAIPPRRMEGGKVKELKSVAKGVEDRLKDVGDRVGNLMGDVFLIANLMGVKEKERKGEDWGMKVKKDRWWREKGRGRMSAREKERVWAEGGEFSEVEDGDWVVDKAGLLVLAGGLLQSQFTEEGWDLEVVNLLLFEEKRRAKKGKWKA